MHYTKFLTKFQLENAARDLRESKKKLSSELKRIRKKLEQTEDMCEVPGSLHSALSGIMENQAGKETDDFYRLFWEEQKKQFGRKGCGQ